MKLVIDEPLRRSALEVASHVAKRLSNPEYAVEMARLAFAQSYFPTIRHWSPISVVHGHAAWAIFFGQMDRCFPNQDWDRVAHIYLRYAAQALEAHPAYSSFLGLFGGVGGLCFATHSLSCNGTRYQRLLGTLDNLLIQRATLTIRLPNPFPGSVGFSDYDLISGPVGIGAYLLLRSEVPEAASTINLILDRLIFLSDWQEQDRRLRFFIPLERQATERHRREYPHGATDCGLAHGVAGPLAFLALADLCGIERPGITEAIQRLANWIINQRYDDTWGINWPCAVPPDGRTSPLEPSRAAWCYGSPGIARALWLAGCALQNASLQDIAIEALYAVQRRPIKSRGIPSPILCHGIAGLLQIVLHFASDTSQPFFAQMASELTQQLLNLFEPDSQVGFRDLEPDEARVDDLLLSLGLGATERLNLYHAARQVQEKALGSQINRLQKTFHSYRKVAQRILGDLDWLYAQPGGFKLAECLRLRASQLLTLGERLRRLVEQEQLSTSQTSFLASCVHMHCNRLLGINRQLEFEVIYYLERTLDSLKRHTPDGIQIK